MPENSTRGFVNETVILDNSMKRTNHAFVVGINEYLYCPKLYNAVKDAKDFIEILTTRYDFEPENITVLFDAEATESNILSSFEKYATRLTPSDNLLIYFSGHGEENKIFKEGYWIPVEAQLGAKQQYIPNSLIKTILNSITAHHIFLIVDSCFSGSLFSTGTRSVTSRLEKDPSRWGLTSGRSEVVADGTPGENSPFAKSLIYALQRTSEPVGVQELCTEVVEMTATNANQTPIGEPLKVEGHRNGQFVFHLKKDENRDWAIAQQTDKIESYQNFIKLYPESKSAEVAKARIVDLTEKIAWEQAVQKNTIIAYFEYKTKYPTGRFVEVALSNIATLEEEEIWANVCQRNTISAFNEYLIKFPNGNFRQEAEGRIKAKIKVTKEAASGGVSRLTHEDISQGLKSKIHAEQTSNLFTFSNRLHDETIDENDPMTVKYEKLMNSKHNLYWIAAASATWLLLVVATVAGKADSTWVAVGFLLSLAFPYYVAYRYPIKNAKKTVIYLTVAFGVFVVIFLLDVALLGGYIGQGNALSSTVLLILIVGTIYSCYQMNKKRYPIIFEQSMII